MTYVIPADVNTPTRRGYGIHLPTFHRESITWRSVDADWVEVSVCLENNSGEATEPDALIIEAAPFGAFVPSEPVGRILVGSLEPGERRSVQTVLPRERLDEVNTRRRLAEMADLDGATEWIGNLNVYFRSRPEGQVERHCAFNLYVRRGITARAMMILDAECSLRVSCSSSDWSAQVVQEGRLGYLTVQTPAEIGSRCKVTVIASGGTKEVPVEFEFETAERGESLGCVTV